jgi:hypothetical protein
MKSLTRQVSAAQWMVTGGKNTEKPVSGNGYSDQKQKPTGTGQAKVRQFVARRSA